MSKTLLTIFVILGSYTPAFAASANGRVKMTVVRTNVQPADIKVVKRSLQKSVEPDSSYIVEVIY